MDASAFSYELLVIDDKSTDNTLAVLREALPQLPQHATDRVPPQRRLGHRPADRHRRRPRPHRRLDRRRHDLPERADPRVRPVPGRPARRRPGRRGPDERAGHDQVPPGAGQVDHPQDRRDARPVRRSPTSTPACGRSGARCRCPTCDCCPPGFCCVTTITMSFLSNQHTVDYLPIDVRQAGRHLEVPLRPRRVPLHPAGPADGHVLQPDQGADAAGALSLFGIGVVKAIVDVVRYHFRITTNAMLLIVTGLIIAAVALLADLIVRSRSD